jgi:hypothetical protein
MRSNTRKVTVALLAVGGLVDKLVEVVVEEIRIPGARESVRGITLDMNIVPIPEDRMETQDNTELQDILVMKDRPLQVGNLISK